MFSFKVIGAFSPILLYSLSEKYISPFYKPSKHFQDKMKFFDKNLGIGFNFNHESDINKFIIDNGIRELMNVRLHYYLNK